MSGDYKIFHWGQYSITLFELISISILFLLTIGINKLLKYYVLKYGNKHKLDVGRLHSLVLLFSYFAWTIAILIALKKVGIHVNYLLGGSAALLVGLGFGLQEIFKDLVAGIFILFEGKVRKGDILELQGVIGKVTMLGLRTTDLINRDGVKIVIPNNKLISDSVVNWSHTKKPARQSVKVSVDYSSDVRKVEAILLKRLNSLPGIELEESYKPTVRLIDFGSSAYQFELLFWTYEYFRFEYLKSDLRYLIIENFHEHGIKIPFPHLVTVSAKEE